MVGEWMRHALSAALAVAIALVGTARAGGAERIVIGLDAGASVPQSPYVASRSESDSLTGAGRPDQNMVSARDPHDPVRIVVELAHQPLIPYLQQARAEHLAAAKSGARIGAAEVSSRLAKAIDSQRQVLEQAQAQLLGDMRREGWIKAEHWRFTGLLDAVSITTRYEHLAAIAKDPRVAAVHMDSKVQALLDTSVGVVGAPAVWSMLDGNGNPVTGQGITIAIIDTGIDYLHPDLGGCFGPDCKVIGGFDFVNGDDDPMDDNGHGTHVAGIAAANGGVRGVAPDAHLLAYKVLDANGSGYNSDVIAAIERAVDPDGDPLTADAADVINMSLGSDEASTGPLALAANLAMDAGAVVVAAAGNYGSYRSLESPGVAERIVTVGAADNNGQIAGFSSRGPVEDSDFAKPEIVAPGVNIRSTWPGGDYHVLSGTSMAAPHVAGGAALLAQLHPMLSPQEIKALLVNNARDLGLDVFTQGAGILDAGLSATAQVVVMPAIPSFGLVDLEQPRWQAQLPVTLRNISTQDWAATVQSAAALPVSVEVAFSQTEGLAVASGQTAAFDLSVVVDNQLLPFADAPTLHHESALSLSSAAGNLRLPWLLFKSARLDLVVHGQPSHVIVSSGDKCPPNGDGGFPCWWPVQETNCFVWDPQNPNTRSVRVSPGKYHAFARYADPSDSCKGFTESVVFKDAVVNSSSTLVIDDADAKNRIHIGEIVDTAGLVINPKRLKIVGRVFNIYHPESALQHIIGQSGFPRDGDTVYRISDVPDGYHLNVDAVATDVDSPLLHRQYFVLGDLLTGGVLSDVALDLDTRPVGGITFEYSDTNELSHGVYFWPAAGLVSVPGIGGLVAKNMGGPKEGPYFSPFKVTAYAARPSGRAGERVAELIVTRSLGQSSDNLEPRTLVDTNPVAILNAGEYVKFDGRLVRSDGRVDLSHINFVGDGDKVAITNGPTYLSARFRFNPYNKQFAPVNPWDSTGYVHDIFSDLRQNLITETMDYQLFCNDDMVFAEVTRALVAQLLDQDCDRLRATFSFPTRIFGHSATSSAEIGLVSDGVSEVETPILHELMLTSDGRLTRVLDGDDLRVRIKASVGFVERGNTGPLSVTLEYRLDDAEVWVPLDVTLADGAYHASLPALDGAHVGALRIQLRDPSGNSMTQTLNALFLLGRDARLLTDAVPAFPGLRDLQVPATGPLTTFDIPPVVASDPLDGAIPATTSSKGPYALGRHSIRWTAVNSADVLGSAIQTLNIVDITPPQVTPPPAVVRPAIGLFTPVDLGQASAADQVDGALSAVPNSTGPFGVGTHLVTWTATDRAGNMGSATQTVTITGDDALPIQGVSSATEAGEQDTALASLPELPDARFAGTPLVAPTAVSATRGVDDSPTLPYDALSDGELWMPVTVPAAPEDDAREYLLLAVAESQTAQELHLFVGEDRDGDGPELAEQRCANTTAAKLQVCELRIARQAGAPESTYWMLAQNIRSGLGNADSIFLRAAAVPLLPENKALVVTGPGHVAADRPFSYRVAWDDPDWLPGEERVGYVLVYATPDELTYYEPLWLKRESAFSAAHMLTPGVPRTLSLAPGQAQDRLYVDIPANATAVTFRSSGSDEVDLYAAHVPDPASPGIAPAPVRELAQYRSQLAGGEQTIALTGSQVLPGRWYLTPVNRGSGNAQVSVSASIDSQEAAPPLRPGHYFDPARSGQGVFVDFAGDQWAMVWYAYLEDGTPTWYFAQAAAPGSDQAQWPAPLYRVAWNGFTTHATVVGNVNLTILPGPVDASPKLTMSFNLDGVSGSEPMTQLGDDTCPSFGGVPLDATGHWYSPERPGFGYSVQFLPHTEVQAAYVYDDLGFPRWLFGQKDFDAEISEVPLRQLSGFCPTCEAKPPTSTVVGSLTRLLSGTSNNDGKPGLIHMDVAARFAPPLSGEWRQNLPVFMLTHRNGCK